MKYFCIGHFKTGTLSYSRAMKMFGLVDLHFPPKYVVQLNQEGVKPWTLRDWDSMSNMHEVEYQDCDALYPDSKFILTTRGIDRWLNSIRHHMEINFPNDIQTQFNLRFQKIYGVPCERQAFDELSFRKVFIQHKEAVRDYFSSTDRLVVLDLDSDEDLLKKLSDFVGKPITYPHANKRLDTRKPGEPLMVGGLSRSYAKAV